MTIDTPISFERRRYGNVTYTWVYAKINGKTVCLGDPWPCINPKSSEIATAIEQEKSRMRGNNP